MASSGRDLFIYIVVDSIIFKSNQIGTTIEDLISSQTSVLNYTSLTSVKNVVFRCEYLFYYSSKMNDNDETFSLAPEICSP